uniref:Aminopeptidase n=1 Tax=Panagrellus redivivus TaxID=6233 RepID=A0A7E4VFJ0_PANRE
MSAASAEVSRKKVRPDLRLRDINDLPPRTSTSTDELRARAKRNERVQGIICAVFGAVSMLALISVILLLLSLSGQLNLFPKHSRCKGDACDESSDYEGLESFDATTVLPGNAIPPSQIEKFTALDEIRDLPGNLVPIAYSVSLTMTDVSDSMVTGQVAIDFDVLKATKKVVLNVDRQVTANVPRYSKIECSPESKAIISTDDSQVEHNRTLELVTFTLSSQLPAGSRCHMTIDIRVTVTASMKGLFRVRSADTKIVGILPLAFNGRRLFPCFDDYPHKVKVDFQFTPPKDLKLLPLAFPTNESGPFEIAMMAASSVVIEKHDGKDFHFATSSPSIHQIFTNAYDFCTRYFHIKMPTKNIVVVATPGLAGEEVVGRNFILYNKALEADLQALKKVAHRGMAKMWLMNAFSLNDWGSRFLYEGVGEYVSQQRWERYSVDAILERAHNLFDGLFYDIADSAPAVYTKTFKYKNEIEEFPLAISRKKASSLFNTFSEIITPENFNEGLIALVKEGFKSEKPIRLSPKQFLSKFKVPPETLGPGDLPFNAIDDFYHMFLHKHFPVLEVSSMSMEMEKTYTVFYPSVFKGTHTPTYSVPIITKLKNSTRLLTWTKRGDIVSVSHPELPIDALCSNYFILKYEVQIRLSTNESDTITPVRRIIDTIIHNMLEPTDNRTPMNRIFEYIFHCSCKVHQFAEKTTRFIVKLFDANDDTMAWPLKSMLQVCGSNYNVTVECGTGKAEPKVIANQCHINYCATKYLPNVESIMRYVTNYITSTDAAERLEAKRGISCVANTTLITGVLQKLFDDNFPKYYLFEALDFIETNPAIRKHGQVFLKDHFEHVFKKIVDINGLSSESIDLLIPGVTMANVYNEVLSDTELKLKINAIPGLANHLAVKHRQETAQRIRDYRRQRNFKKTSDYFESRQKDACDNGKITLNCIYTESRKLEVME